MLKPIFTTSLLSFCLFLPHAAYAALNPIPLLVEQCLRLPYIDFRSALDTLKIANPSDQQQELPLAEQALVFEQQTIGLNNINDRLKYYRGFNLSSQERQGLLQCQLHLANNLAQLLNQAELKQLSDSLIQGNNEQILLSSQLKSLLNQHWSEGDKTKLHTAQAGIQQGLASQQFNLNIQNVQCQLPTDTQGSAGEIDLNEKTNEPKHTEFSDTIANYLLKQKDPECRQAVWQAYQGRASERNKAALRRIADLRQEAATAAGFNDYASLRLSTQQLSSPALVKAFLDSQTKAINIAPWDLGQHLSALEAANGPMLSTQLILSQGLAYLTTFGLSFEPLDTNNPKQLILRVYHQYRLLGELYISLNEAYPRSTHNTLRQSVVGQQFGQQTLDLKPQLGSYKDIEQFTQAIAEAITSLARGSHFYLNNTLAPTLDTHQLASLWLTKMLQHHLFPQFEEHYLNKREHLARAYIQQLKVFRAKVALYFYQSFSTESYLDLGTEFEKSFGQSWSQPNNYQYSFYAIANEGPLYYQPLWQSALAELVYQTTLNSQDKLSLFNLIVVNEDGLSLNNLLTASIGAPVDPTSLIQRMTIDLKSTLTPNP